MLSRESTDINSYDKRVKGIIFALLDISGALYSVKQNLLLPIWRENLNTSIINPINHSWTDNISKYF